MNFKLFPQKIRSLYSTPDNSGCLASNRITVDGLKVGYMYREDGDSSFPDSGWRFFAGDETEDYTNDPNNFHIFDLNTICNYDSDIIPFLDAKEGSAFVRKGNSFVPD